MIYIDSNIFIYSVTDSEELGKECIKLLELIENNRTKYITSTLTFDEVFYKIKKLVSLEDAITFTERLLTTNNLSFVSVDTNIILKSLSLIKKLKLMPRDAVHLACALSNKADLIITQDKDFTKINEINIKDVFNYAQEDGKTPDFSLRDTPSSWHAKNLAKRKAA